MGKKEIRKMELVRDKFHQVFGLCTEIQETLGEDFEDLGDFASALGTLSTFGTALTNSTLDNLRDEAKDKGGD